MATSIDKGKAAQNGARPELAVHELLGLLAQVRRQAWTLLTQSNTFQQPRPDRCRRLIDPRPEYEVDAPSHLERVALQLQQMAARGAMTKYKSDDSLGGLAPPAGQILTLDVNEFLKHFNEDGTAVKTDRGILRPTRSPSRRFCRYSSEEIKMSDWPDCLRSRDHDVYYNCEERSTIERKCQRLRSRLQTVETASTCTLQQARSPSTLTIPDPVCEAAAAVKTAEHSSSSSSGRPPSKSPPVSRQAVTRKRLRDESQGQKGGHDDLVTHSKRLLMERKKRQEEKLRLSGQQKQSNVDKAGRESRSERHKRKLEQVVSECLERHGVAKDSSLYPACMKKLFTLTKCFVKDLKTSHNLRQEMEKIAESQVEQVIEFEKRMKT